MQLRKGHVMDLETLVDPEGFLLDLNTWTPEVAVRLAQREGIDLSDEHWAVLNATRAFFQEFDASPSMRLLVKWLKQNDLAKYASSIQLLRLFPESPAKLASMLAGLPKPDNCL